MHGGMGGHGGGMGHHGGGGHSGGGHHSGQHGGHGTSIGSLLGSNGHHAAGGIFAHLAHMLGAHHHGGHGAGHGAGQGNHPQNAPNWSSALQAEKLGDKILKIDPKPGLYAFGFFALLVFWLFVIRWVHTNDDPNHLVSKETWAQQIAAKNPRSLLPPQGAAANQGTPVLPAEVPLNFGAPGPDLQAPASAMAQQMPTAGNLGDAPYSARTFSARMPATNLGVMQSLMPQVLHPSQGGAPPMNMGMMPSYGQPPAGSMGIMQACVRPQAASSASMGRLAIGNAYTVGPRHKVIVSR